VNICAFLIPQTIVMMEPKRKINGKAVRGQRLASCDFKAPRGAGSREAEIAAKTGEGLKELLGGKLELSEL